VAVENEAVELATQPEPEQADSVGAAEEEIVELATQSEPEKKKIVDLEALLKAEEARFSLAFEEELVALAMQREPEKTDPSAAIEEEIAALVTQPEPEETDLTLVVDEDILALATEPEPKKADPSAVVKGNIVDLASLFKSAQNKGPAPEQDRKAYNWLPKRISVRHVVGNQNEIAFGTNYTTLSLLFAPPYTIGEILPMVDLRGHRFDDNTYAATAGFVARYIPYPDTFCNLLGFNAYYDYREGGIGYYQQVSGGVEILGKRWDFRGNVYVPFGPKESVKVCVYDYGDDLYAINRLLEEVSYSFNAEVGYYLIRSEKNFLFYMAGGPYFIAGRCGSYNTVGGEFRVRPQYRDYIALDLSISHDPLFETIWQALVIVNLPLYQIGNQNKKPCGISDRQIFQPVEQFEVMPLMRQSCWRTNY
jgi:hypothetical protein